jgi:hypothetical protein
MKTAHAVTLGIMALLLNACVSGDEITSYVIDPDGSVEFSVYRYNLTSSEEADPQKDLAGYIRALEEKSDDLFAKLLDANAREVRVTVLRRTSPAAVVITGRIPSLPDLAAYLSEKVEDDSLVCTAIPGESARGIVCELIRAPSGEEPHSDTAGPEVARPNSAAPEVDLFNATRFALAEGRFTKAQGFRLEHDKKTAVYDYDVLDEMWNSKTPSIFLSLEWQIPGAP